MRALVGGHARLVATAFARQRADVRDRAPADPDAREVGGAERGRLRRLGEHDGNAEDVGLELHQPRVRGGAAVDAQLGEGPSACSLHRAHRVMGLVGDRLERRARDVRAGAAAGETDDRPARLRIPVGRAQAGEGGNEVDAIVAIERRREGLGVGGRVDDPQAVAQPLHRRARDEDRSLQGVRRGGADLPRHRREQSRCGLGRGKAGVQEREGAGAVGVLAETRIDAGLAEEGGLLIAGDPRERHRMTVQRVGQRPREHPRAGPDLGQCALGDVEQVEQLGVPATSADVVQKRARGVRGVGEVLAGELEREPRVDRAEHRAAVAGAFAQARDVLQQPGDLRGREVGVEHEAGSRAHERLVPLGAQPLAQRRGAAVLPDDRAMQRLAGRQGPTRRPSRAGWRAPLPQARPGRCRRRRRAPRPPPLGSPTTVRRDRARPSRAEGSAARTRDRRARSARSARRRRSRSCPSSPGRWRGSSWRCAGRRDAASVSIGDHGIFDRPASHASCVCLRSALAQRSPTGLVSDFGIHEPTRAM